VLAALIIVFREIFEAGLIVGVVLAVTRVVPHRNRWIGGGVVAGSVTALVIGSLAGSSLGFLNKAGCRAGAWNIGAAQYQAHCYTDIYPLYFVEGLWHGQVPYFDHQVEYPVLIGGAMQAVSWLVRPITDPYIRGREFFDITVVLITLCAIAGVLATAYLAGRSRRWTALLVALAPGLILASFINWDMIAMALTAVAMAATMSTTLTAITPRSRNRLTRSEQAAGERWIFCARSWLVMRPSA